VPDLSFDVEKAEAVAFAAAPTLSIKLRVVNANRQGPVHTVALRCQIMIEPARRRYGAHERRRLLDLFGEPERWGQTLRPMLWIQASAVVPPFTGSTVVDLQVACSFDFNVAATKYFAGLEAGEVPLNLLFSGTIFYEAEGGALQVAQIPWHKEARFRLPVKVWKEMMDLYYPNVAWLCLRREVFDRLYQYKMDRGFPTWEQAIEGLLPEAEKNARAARGPDAGEAVH
jgi:hypothetical protein